MRFCADVVEIAFARRWGKESRLVWIWCVAGIGMIGVSARPGLWGTVWPNYVESAIARVRATGVRNLARRWGHEAWCYVVVPSQSASVMLLWHAASGGLVEIGFA